MAQLLKPNKFVTMWEALSIWSLYNYSFINYDWTVLDSGQIEAWQTPQYVWEVPYKPSTSTHTYSFSWRSPEVWPIGLDGVIYKAQFTEVAITYTVTWKNYDWTVLEVDRWLTPGTMPEYNSATPTKPGGYRFIWWSPTVVAVTGDAEYTAQFELQYWAVNFYEIDEFYWNTYLAKTVQAPYWTLIETLIPDQSEIIIPERQDWYQYLFDTNSDWIIIDWETVSSPNYNVYWYIRREQSWPQWWDIRNSTICYFRTNSWEYWVDPYDPTRKLTVGGTQEEYSRKFLSDTSVQWNYVTPSNLLQDTTFVSCWFMVETPPAQNSAQAQSTPYCWRWWVMLDWQHGTVGKYDAFEYKTSSGWARWPVLWLQAYTRYHVAYWEDSTGLFYEIRWWWFTGQREYLSTGVTYTESKVQYVRNPGLKMHIWDTIYERQARDSQEIEAYYQRMKQYYVDPTPPAPVIIDDNDFWNDTSATTAIYLKRWQFWINLWTFGSKWLPSNRWTTDADNLYMSFTWLSNKFTGVSASQFANTIKFVAFWCTAWVPMADWQVTTIQFGSCWKSLLFDWSSWGSPRTIGCIEYYDLLWQYQKLQIVPNSKLAQAFEWVFLAYWVVWDDLVYFVNDSKWMIQWIVPDMDFQDKRTLTIKSNASVNTERRVWDYIAKTTFPTDQEILAYYNRTKKYYQN